MTQIHLDIAKIYFGCTNKYKTQIHSSWGGTCLLTNFQKVFRKHLNIHLTQTLLPLINFQSHYLLKPNSARYAFHSLYWMCCRWNKCLRKRRCFPFCGGFMKMPKFSCFFSWPAEFKYEPSIFLFSGNNKVSLKRAYHLRTTWSSCYNIRCIQTLLNPCTHSLHLLSYPPPILLLKCLSTSASSMAIHYKKY